MKIIPDKIFLLNMADHVCKEKLTQKLFLGVGAVYNTEREMHEIARNAIVEYRVNLQGVKD
jgi:hypothetical protein